MKELKDRGMWFVCADMDGTLMYDMDSTYRSVWWSEWGRWSQSTRKEKLWYGGFHSNEGDIDSLNASVAAGVLSYEIVRQRMKKG